MLTKDRALVMALGAACATGLFMGCGGDSDGGDEVTTGIAPSKLLSEITPAEAAQACERLRTGLREALTVDFLIRSLCTLQAAAGEETESACNAARDRCIDEANQPGTDAMMAIDAEEVDFPCDGGAVLMECTSTVGELETCFNDSLDVVQSALGQITCADATSIQPDDIDTFGEDTLQPAASCEALECGPNSPFAPD